MFRAIGRLRIVLGFKGGRATQSQPFVTNPIFIALAALLIAIHITTLHLLGQPWIAADGVVRLWESDPFSPRMSQELADWYSFSHFS